MEDLKELYRRQDEIWAQIEELEAEGSEEAEAKRFLYDILEDQVDILLGLK